MRNTWYDLIVVCGLVVCAISAHAQQRPSSVSEDYGREQVRSSRDTSGNFIQQRDKFFNEIVNEDTLDASYYNLLLPSNIQRISDTSIHQYSHHYDWTRIRQNDYAHLGNVGSAAIPIVYEQYDYEGRDIGLHQFDIWKFGEKDRRFYDLTKSFTHFGYSQSNQANQVFTATFARAFDDNINIAVDYRRINQLGIYQQHDIDHSNLHFGLNYNSPGGRYKAYLSHLSNGLEGDESGGVATDTLFGQIDFEKAAAIPVRLAVSSDDGATFRHQERNYQLYQSYRLIRDSSDLSKPQITLSNALTYENSFYRYGDALIDNDLDFYPSAFQVNPQGLRMLISEKVFSNHFKVFLGKTVNPLDSNSRKTHIEAGLKLKNHSINNEIADSTIFDIILTGGGLIDLGKSVTVFTDNHFVVAGDNAGAYKISGDFLIDLNKAGTLKASLLNQNHRPSFIHQQAPVSGQYLWQNDFANINELSINARYGIESIKTEVGFGYHLLNNYIYFDQNYNPIQNSAEISILQLSVTKNFKLGHFHLDNYGVYQASSSTALPLPSFLLKHSLYYQGNVFKNRMLLRTGFEARIVEAYEGYTYMPLIGQFAPSTEGSLGQLSQLDFFLSFKVGQMRVFAKMENVGDFWNTKKSYFFHDYPIYDSTFRFGLSWYLIN